ncbi:MAG: 30S ribosomal protein S5, partial [Halobacteriales archaeon]
RHILELAGIEDAWTKSHGNTRTTMNLAKATYNALANASRAREGGRRRTEPLEEPPEEPGEVSG